MKLKTAHVYIISKRRPQSASDPACDNHDTEKKRSKCHKGKVAPTGR